VAVIIKLTAPVMALESQIKPQNPKLGDTITVTFPNNNPGIEPTVTTPTQNYPAFPLTENGDRYRAFIPTTPLDRPGTLNIRIKTGDESQNLAIALANRTFPVQRIRLSGKANQDATQLELDRVNAFKKLVTPQKFWQGKFIAPSAARLSTGFGIRRYYNGVFAEDYYHRGLDYAGGMGSPVVAPAAGRVELIGREADGFRVHGNIIGIDHGQGVGSVFLHLSKINVKQGDFVVAGQKIGAIGSTGASTGPHLHWGLYVNGLAVDPTPWRFQGID
jgi:murein DD-endopeptidase MepM/ murein hydrolase activator NlpD